MKIREVEKGDLQSLLMLYTQLHDNDLPLVDLNIEKLWADIIEDKNHHIFVGFLDDVMVSSCVLMIVPNLTHHQRPYALIENMITHVEHRNKGYATLLLNFARDVAQRENCYKIMLLTSAKTESTLHFYEKAGYNRQDKTAFIQWL